MQPSARALQPRVQRLILTRIIKSSLILLALSTTLEVLSIRRALSLEASKPPPPFGNQKVFIASLHWTDERVLREYWVPALRQLAQDIGRESVFVSVFESGSLDDTKGALRDLDDQLTELGIDHRVVLDETTHLDEVTRTRDASNTGWVQMPATKSYRQDWTDWFELQKDSWVPRRIPYLARLRNQVMEPLASQQSKGITYDKVLWLNDVVFTTADVQTLLATRDGDYAAACALDFKQATRFYDSFATRDAQGHAPLTDTWPFFRSAVSRDALMRGQPVPVASCWNGMVAFDAEPIYHSTSSSGDSLAFRGIPDSLAGKHVEASECCLVHADNPLSAEKRVWVNPNVRVGYDGTAYEAVNHGGVWPSVYAIAVGMWRNRLLRWLRLARAPVDWVVEARLREWKRVDSANVEPGAFCLIDEMQVLLWNGWGHA
ncbi:hypothetical protein LTR91_005089 [Friedmanniomyces endolithicus]|uniref:Polysaccharide export protein n=1 Tax=Friedmanniomyces endolithicus TaxID=329885 RepID=A0AAN6KUL3_9PEZI|nr:hypothetical protein LTR75_017701 [Friedmanniomyces endolithicus]KAK0807411.1 hypothetical protein LTR59_003254 [Friedmanniomyces endolithicus]KAK0831989.1 hypothetical protein LTR03_015285 [Friedmanniomyces endolithicus]KAK0839438.1 hypothetical protein LTS02_017484 [Friedmanniomyces endolithicus]KAK0877635.1 hypothetical protein LTR87_008549 [Friedmanniomyces endolithicus]